MSEIIIGIDLGTTNSEVAVPVEGRIEILDIDGVPMLPSVVGLDDDGQVIVGIKARNQYVLHPDRTIKSIKRKMGRDETVNLGDQALTPQEVSAMILRELKTRAEAYLKSPVAKAVVTVPAFFSDAQRQATRDAGSIAGLEVVRIINEPTAACLAFEHDDPNARKTIMAFDLGGGTFDVSIVKMDGSMVEVEGSHGDTHLGGDDIDQALFDELLNRLHSAHPDTPFKLTEVSRHRLLRAAETAKIRLSEDDSVSIIEDNLQVENGDILNLREEITRMDLDQLIAGLLRKTIGSLYKALAEADVSIEQIDEILLVGGSTRTPAVAELLESEFGKRPRIDVHPDLAVAYGAGVMAARTQGRDDHRILVDITPYTFGTSALGVLGGEMVPHVFCPIIKAGTPLPVNRSQTFYTSYPGQECIEVTAFEGESKDARDNILLGDFKVEGLDTSAPVHSEIIIRMSLDLDGILHVQATEKSTGLSKDIRIENSLGKLSEDALKEARARVAEMFKSPFDDIDDDLQEAERTEDDAGISELIARTERAMDSMDEVDKADAEAAIARLKTGTENNAPAESLQHDVDELEDLLFYLDTSQ